MKTVEEIKKENNLIIEKIQPIKESEFWIDGRIHLAGEKKQMLFVASNYGGWEHVSVSYKKRCPIWEEMCKVKDIFFYENEWVVQYHPAKDAYVNLVEYCLHMWKPMKEKLPLPCIDIYKK